MGVVQVLYELAVQCHKSLQKCTMCRTKQNFMADEVKYVEVRDIEASFIIHVKR